MYTVIDDALVIDGEKHTTMPYPIRKVIQLSDLFVVLLDIPGAASMTENIIAVNREGQIVWQIERIPETSIHPKLWYADMTVAGEGLIRAFNWNGYAVDVDSRTGRVGARTWSK